MLQYFSRDRKSSNVDGDTETFTDLAVSSWICFRVRSSPFRRVPASGENTTVHRRSAKFPSAIFVTNSFTYRCVCCTFLLLFYISRLVFKFYPDVDCHAYCRDQEPISFLPNLFSHFEIGRTGFTTVVMALVFFCQKNASYEIKPVTILRICASSCAHAFSGVLMNTFMRHCFRFIYRVQTILTSLIYVYLGHIYNNKLFFKCRTRGSRRAFANYPNV